MALEHDSATGDVCLIVSDNGIGLPVDFDWRQSSSLGLDIVQMLAGQIRASVQTGPGPGTEFRIKFDIRWNPIMSMPTILIVEDEAIISKDIANKLRRLGYEFVGSTDTGEKAIE